MCGIAGIFEFRQERRVERSVLEGMNRQIVHRGPDDDGFYLDGSVGLAMRRLSIIDLATGSQPLSNEEGTIWIVFNGEIYNHVELRRQLEDCGHRYRTRSDTETIVHLYEEYGKDCVHRLRGMFAFAIWDTRRRRLFCARDRLGIKPFYFVRQNERLLFASEIKALLRFPGVHAELRRAALPEYLALGYLSGAGTLFAGVEKLPPGHRIEADEDGQVQIDCYWDLPQQTEEPRSERYYVGRYRELLEQAVESHLMSDVPLGMLLSGGLDSSIVAALMQRKRQDRIQTFSVGYPEAQSSELPMARLVAAHLGTEHHEVQISAADFFGALPKLIWHEDEPLVWPSSVSLYFVCRLAGEHVKVVLTGEGSDESLAGYTRYAWTLWNRRMDRAYRCLLPRAIRHWVKRQVEESSLLSGQLRRSLQHTCVGRDGSSIVSFYFDNFYAAFSAAEQTGLLADGLAGDPYRDCLDYWANSSGEFLSRLLYTDCKTYLVELLMKQDNMSMAASIESRVPYLDHIVLEFAARIPAHYKIRRLAGKQILKKAAGDLLPSAVIYQRKRGFPTPWRTWLESGWLDHVERLLLEPRTLERGLFRRGVLERLFAEHRRGAVDHSDRVWRLLNLEIWQRVYLDDEPCHRSASSTEGRPLGLAAHKAG